MKLSKRGLNLFLNFALDFKEYLKEKSCLSLKFSKGMKPHIIILETVFWKPMFGLEMKV